MNVPMLPQVVATPQGDVPSRSSGGPGQRDAFADLLANPPVHDAGGEVASPAEPPSMSARPAQHAGDDPSLEIQAVAAEAGAGVVPLSVVTSFGAVAVDPFNPSLAAQMAGGLPGVAKGDPAASAADARSVVAVGIPALALAAVEGASMRVPITGPVPVPAPAPVEGRPAPAAPEGSATVAASANASASASAAASSSASASAAAGEAAPGTTAAADVLPTTPTAAVTTPELPTTPSPHATSSVEPPTMSGPAAQDLGPTRPTGPVEPPTVQGTGQNAATTPAPTTPAPTTPAPATTSATGTTPPTSAAPEAPTATAVAVTGLRVHGGNDGGSRDSGGHQGRSRERSAQPVEALAAPAAVGVGVAGPAAPAYASRNADPAGTSAVTGQVFPEVARLVTRGDGTQRLTVKLNPEALGEVRIVLTVRNGDVHVRMTGSDAAHQALLNGAPELQRLLDRAGAGASQVVVGDGSAANHGTDRGSSSQGHRDSSQPYGPQDGTPNDAGRHQPNHRTAGTRDGSTAATDGAAGGTRPRSSTDPAAGIGGVTRTRLAGVDVTM